MKIISYESYLSKLYIFALLICKYSENIKLRDFAINLVKNTKFNTIEQLKKIYDYVFYEIRYQGDIKDIDTIYNPLKTIEIKAGDCDDKTILVNTLLKTLGYEPIIFIAGNRNFTHIFSGTILNNEYVYMDTSTKQYAFNILPEYKFLKVYKII